MLLEVGNGMQYHTRCHAVVANYGGRVEGHPGFRDQVRNLPGSGNLKKKKIPGNSGSGIPEYGYKFFRESGIRVQIIPGIRD